MAEPKKPAEACRCCGHARKDHHRGQGACGFTEISGTGCDTEGGVCLCTMFWDTGTFGRDPPDPS